MADHDIDPRTGLPIGRPVDATPARFPDAVVLQGRYARLEPLAARHAADLYAASSGEGAAARFRYLIDCEPQSVADIEQWIPAADCGGERVGFAVVDTATGVAGGRLFLMRIAPAMRRIEVGNILFGPSLARTRVATEAIYLLARQCLEDWRYRRFEWKCDNLNEPSRRAAARFGFAYEGLFRRDLIVKGRSRDTAWFSITDEDWPRVRDAFDRWLDPANFDASGRQLVSLEAMRADHP